MEARKFRLHDGRRGAALAVRVTPRASRNEITEIQPDGTVKVRLMAAPETEANAALITFLAGVLGVPENKIEIVAGASGRDKLLSVLDIEKDEVQQRLLAYLE
ncbi:MAG: hypothetical protein DDG60_09095 [Anaerolineae bacterium]|nr:MAG: hypothetical protein DDG60_09095 [Anaerolineae bacterium]